MVANLTTSEPNPAQKRTRRRKITVEDMEAICTLVVTRRLTETEAASLQGISQAQWFHFKQLRHNQPRFEQIITRLRASNIDSCLKTIDEAGDKRTYVNKKGEVVECSGDWRAKAWIAERVLAPDRFADKRNDNTPAQPIIQVTILNELARQVYGAPTIEVAPEAKALPQASESPNGS